MDQLEKSIRVIVENDLKKADALADERSANAGAAKLRATIVTPLDKDTSRRLNGIRQYLLENEESIKAEKGKTIRLDKGTVKWFVRERVDLPADTEPVVSFFLGRHFGKRYLVQKWAPSKDAIKSANRRLKNILRDNFGVFIGDVKHLTLSIESRKEPISLHEVRMEKRQTRITR
jgi:hypothetical protein